MYYTFQTSSSQGILTGPTLLTSVTDDIHPDPNLTLAIIGLRNMNLIQPKRNLIQNGEQVREEFFRFRECVDDPEQPRSITSVVETRRLLTTEELYILTKSIPITVVVGKSAADITLNQGDAPAPTPVEGGAQQHRLKEFVPIYPLLASVPLLASASAHSAPPTPKFFCGGSVMQQQPQWRGPTSYHVSGGCPKPFWGVENHLKVQPVANGARAPPGFNPFLEQEGHKSGNIGMNHGMIGGGQMAKMPGQGSIPNGGGFNHHQQHSPEFRGFVGNNGDAGPAFRIHT